MKFIRTWNEKFDNLQDTKRFFVFLMLMTPAVILIGLENPTFTPYGYSYLLLALIGRLLGK